MVTSEFPEFPDGDAPYDPHAALTPKKEEAILALLSQPTVTKAAETVKIGERTLHRWMREDKAFIAAYRAARREVFGHAVAMTQKYAGMAVQVLAKVMTDPTAQHAARVSAAVAILRFGREGIELEDLQDRVEALEASMTTESAGTRR